MEQSTPELDVCSAKKQAGDAGAAAPEMVAGKEEPIAAASKMRPKVRIVHIIAPEIIQTDAKNFRELVQRLTGKHAKKGGDRKRPAEAAQPPESSSPEVSSVEDCLPPAPRKRVKLEEEEPQLGPMDISGSLCDFGVLEAFMQEMCDMPPIPFVSIHGDLLSEELVCG